MKQLQKQLEQLQEALTSRNPTSVAALVHAARPTLEETEEVRTLRGANMTGCPLPHAPSGLLGIPTATALAQRLGAAF